MKILWGKMAVMTVVSIVIMTVAGCGETKGEVKGEKAVYNVLIKFESENITSKMKIQGTGQNYGGVTNKTGWNSSGTGAHWLVLDGIGIYEGINLEGIVGILRIKAEVVLNDKVVLKSSIRLDGEKVLSISLSNTEGDKVRLMLEGSNISIQSLSLFGKYNGLKDLLIA